MKRALAVSGGGSKGAFSVGAITNLVKERGLWFDITSGVSIGALNTLMLTQAANRTELAELVDRLAEIWLGFESNDQIYKRWYDIPLIPESWKDIANAALTLLFKKDSLFHIKPARKLIYGIVDPARIKQSPILGFVGTVDLLSRQYLEYETSFGSETFVEAAIASGAIPLTFPPVTIGKRKLVDGGVREGTPLRSAIETLQAMWPDEEKEVYTIVHSGLPGELLEPELLGIDLSGWLKVAEQALGAMKDEVHINDVRHVLELKECGAFPNLTLYLIYASQSLGSGLDFGNHEQHVVNLAHGIERARLLGQKPLRTRSDLA